MIRAVELSLFLLPFAVYFGWRRYVATGRVPTRNALLALMAGVLVLGGGLAWSGLHERHKEGTHYIPAQMQDGQIVPGHGA